jgi:cation diffusion facilitator family transporter
MKSASEQGALKLSIMVTTVIGVAGVVGGFIIDSQAIMFDGMYSFVDVMLTFGSLAVSKLLAQAPTRRFQFGYWHLEPLVATVQSAILATACVYALINALQGLTTGGHAVSYGLGMIWAGALCVVGMAMAVYMNRLAHAQNSTLLAVDARSWLLSGGLSLALLLAYGIAVLLAGTARSDLVPYVDSAVLLCMSLALLPVPLKTLIQTVREVLQVAPRHLDERVRSVMDKLVAERGYLRYSSYVAQVGRARFVEIHILVPPDLRIGTVQAVDALRREIAARLDATWPETWLTIDLTADPAWL